MLEEKNIYYLKYLLLNLCIFNQTENKEINNPIYYQDKNPIFYQEKN